MPNTLRKSKKSQDLSSLRSDVTYLFHVVNLQAKKLDVLLEQHGREKESARFVQVQHTAERVGESEASLLRHDVDKLTEIVTKQGLQLDWLMSRVVPRSGTGYCPTGALHFDFSSCPDYTDEFIVLRRLLWSLIDFILSTQCGSQLFYIRHALMQSHHCAAC